ncbi:MAG TPA: hypothetical protein VJZ71_13215 [Phycisphaerae bacterium]|nr:hypothetical protein [Phycisphaerae bacterium]
MILLLALFGNELAHRRDQLDRNLHHGSRAFFVRSLIFGDGFVLGLALVVFENAANALLVSARWKILAHGRFRGCAAYRPAPAYMIA